MTPTKGGGDPDSRGSRDSLGKGLSQGSGGERGRARGWR